MDKVKDWNGEAKAARKLKDGSRFNHLFPRAELKDTLIKRGAEVKDTIRFIPKAVKLTKWQVKALVREELTGYPLMEICRRIWQFLYGHIAYKKDAPGKEQIRAPSRTWHDRVADCDDFSTFISCILSVMKIPHTLRVTKYKGGWQHIYVVVPVPGARHITLDCVVDRFNYEVPYTEKMDVDMDLEFLSGLDSASEKEKRYAARVYPSYDVDGLDSDFEELGKLLRKGVLKSVAKAGGKVVKKAGEVAKKGLHVINRLNPATLLLRNGVLAAMKINMMGVASKIKWAYLTEAQAISKGIDPARHRKLKQVLSRLEKIYHGAGGKTSNLKNAILKGKGNARKEVSGLGLIDPQEIVVYGLDESLPLSELLGIEMYLSENQEYLNGLHGELGEPATGAALAAASSAIAAISAALKQVGNIFKGKHPDFTNAESGGTTQPAPQGSEGGSNSLPKSEEQESSIVDEASPLPPQEPESNNLPPETPANTETPEERVEPESDSESTAFAQSPSSKAVQPVKSTVPVRQAVVQPPTTPETKEERGFLEKYGTALKVTGYVVAGAGVIFILSKLLKKDMPQTHKGRSGMAGTPKNKKRIGIVPLD